MPEDSEHAATGHIAAGEQRWRGAGDRIDTLLDAMSASGTAARERAEQLVGEVVELYGAGLGRIVAELDHATMRRLLDDDLIASLLLVHGLHPDDVHTRVATALDSVRPYLGSHGGDVRLLDVTAGVVSLELTGSCRSCPSSSVTLELAVEDAVRSAAPEIESIEVVAAQSGAEPAVIAPDSLFAHVRSAGSWVAVPELEGLAAGEVGGFEVAGSAVLACRVGDEIYAYRDHCPSCARSMAGAALHRGISGDPVLRCPSCHAHYDVVHAGARLDGDGHLEPLPVLVRSGELSVAVPVGVGG